MPYSSNDGGKRLCAFSLFFDLAQIVERADNVSELKRLRVKTCVFH
jgi:hypothetical protein